MVRLKHTDIRTIDNAFAMHGGYVLDFSDRTFAEFFEDEFGVDIDEDKYRTKGTSKAKRLRAFIAIEGHYMVAKVLRGLWAYRESLPVQEPSPYDPPKAPSDVKSSLFGLITRIEGGGVVTHTDAIDRFSRDETLEELVSAIERDIQVDKPAAALDRLHTYCMKKTVHLIEAHGGTCGRDEPLHSRMGKYVRLIESERQLRDISKRALKSGISIFQSFNDIRNNESFAHDNDLVSHEEARYIFDSISALLRFIKAMEADKFGI